MTIVLILILLALGLEHKNRRQDDYTGTAMIMCYFVLPLLLVAACSTSTTAQVSNNKTNTYTTTSSTSTLILTIDADTEIDYHFSKSSRIQMTTVIEMRGEKASQSIFSFLSKKGRYDNLLERTDDRINIDARLPHTIIRDCVERKRRITIVIPEYISNVEINEI